MFSTVTDAVSTSYSSVPIDILVLAAVVAVFWVYGMAAGRRRLLTLLVALPFATFLSIALPGKAALESSTALPAPIVGVVLFIALLCATALALRGGFAHTHSARGPVGWLLLIIPALLATGLVLSLTLWAGIDTRPYYEPSATILRLFSSSSALFAWLAAALVYLFVHR